MRKLLILLFYIILALTIVGFIPALLVVLVSKYTILRIIMYLVVTYGLIKLFVEGK